MTVWYCVILEFHQLYYDMLRFDFDSIGINLIGAFLSLFANNFIYYSHFTQFTSILCYTLRCFLLSQCLCKCVKHKNRRYSAIFIGNSNATNPTDLQNFVLFFFLLEKYSIVQIRKKNKAENNKKYRNMRKCNIPTASIKLISVHAYARTAWVWIWLKYRNRYLKWFSLIVNFVFSFFRCWDESSFHFFRWVEKSKNCRKQTHFLILKIFA